MWLACCRSANKDFSVKILEASTVADGPNLVKDVVWRPDPKTEPQMLVGLYEELRSVARARDRIQHGIQQDDMPGAVAAILEALGAWFRVDHLWRAVRDRLDTAQWNLVRAELRCWCRGLLTAIGHTRARILDAEYSDALGQICALLDEHREHLGLRRSEVDQVERIHDTESHCLRRC